MNANSQLDFHPDAESLNAFAEKALSERERGQIVAHLAVCGRCRQVIFLAGQAAPELEMAAAAASAHSARRSGSWLSGWRVAWIPAVALASAAALIVLVHVRHVEPSAEMAKATIPAAPQNAASIANTAVNNRSVAEKPNPPVSHAMEKPPELGHQTFSTGAAYVPNPEETAPPTATANQPLNRAAAPPQFENGIVMLPTAPAGQEYSTSAPVPQPPTAHMPQRETGAYSSNSAAVYAPQAKMDEMGARARSSQKAQARFNGAGGSSTAQYKKEAAPGSSYDASSQMPAIEFEAARRSIAATLPSGLAIISTATALNSTLAIDQAGALFLSEDSGSSWVAVPQQWTGRAVEVILLQSATSAKSVVTPTGSATATPAAAAVFELMNDKNQVWVSIDGKSWKAQ